MGVYPGKKKQSTLRITTSRREGGRSLLQNIYPSLAKNNTKENQSRNVFQSASSRLVLQPETAELPFLCFSAKNIPKNKKSNRHLKATVASEASAINIRSSKEQHC